MPLRDHFRPPVSSKSSWEGFHAVWPTTIVQQLCQIMPDEFTAEPRVHLGAFFEIDVCGFEDDVSKRSKWSESEESGGVATAIWAPPRPTLAIDVDLPDQYEYAVEIYDQSRGRKLVAAIEIVSPGNKDRPESRRAFATKCAALLQQGVCVSIVDIVTVRNFNLYCEMFERFDREDPAFELDSPPIYATTSRYRTTNTASRLESWAYPLAIGQALPILPLWLTEDLAIGLDLEPAYEHACRSLRIA